MPVRQMKESLEQHIVIKTNLQKSKNAPEPSSEQNIKQTSLQPRNKGRRRGRGGRKSDQIEILMRTSTSSSNGNVGCPTSSKSLNFASRPGFGTVGTKCIVKANHFFAELPDKDLNQYDVTITPEVSSRTVNRSIIAELVRLYKESDLGMRLPAYDGRKSLYTAGQLPFSWKDFMIKLVDEEDGVNCPKRVKEYRVVIKFVAKANLHHLGKFLAGKRADAPQEALQILDIVLRELSTKRYCPIGRSFFSPDIRKPQRLGEGLESWCGFYQSIRPTQMGLSLNIDMASAAFIEPLPVVEFVGQLLGKDVLSRPLSDANRIKVKKGLRGVKVEVTHRGSVRRKYRVSGLTSQPTRELVFPVDENSTMKSLVEYFQEMYGFTIQYSHLPCLQVVNQKKANYLPMEGTSRPAHYHVLWDENNFTADGIQSLTNNLCYTYAGCTRSISIVPPAYYTHLAAFRARFFMEPGIQENGSIADGGNCSHSSKGTTRAAGECGVKPLPALKDNVKRVVFYR